MYSDPSVAKAEGGIRMCRTVAIAGKTSQYLEGAGTATLEIVSQPHIWRWPISSWSEVMWWAGWMIQENRVFSEERKPSLRGMGGGKSEETEEREHLKG